MAERKKKKTWYDRIISGISAAGPLGVGGMPEAGRAVAGRLPSELGSTKEWMRKYGVLGTVAGGLVRGGKDIYRGLVEPAVKGWMEIGRAGTPLLIGQRGVDLLKREPKAPAVIPTVLPQAAPLLEPTAPTVPPVAEQIAPVTAERARAPFTRPIAPIDIAKTLAVPPVEMPIPEALTAGLPAEPALTPRPEAPGIWSTAPRPDLGYVLGKLGEAIMPEGSTIGGIGRVGAQLSQQAVYSEYISDMLQGVEPDRKALRILSPEQRLSVVQEGEEIRKRKFGEDVERLKQEEKTFKLEKDVRQFNALLEQAGRETISKEKIEAARIEGRIKEEEIRAEALTQARAQQPATRSEASEIAHQIAARYTQVTLGDDESYRDMYVEVMAQYNYPVTPEEAGVEAKPRKGAALDELIRETK